MKRALCIAILVAGLATPAIAADIPARMPVKAPVVAPIFNWTGFYGGVNAGYGWGGDTLDISVTPGGFVGSAGSLDLNGWFAGFQGGYNIQQGSTVFGIEGDFQWAGMDDSISFAIPAVIALAARAEIEKFATIRARLGHAQGRTLWYLTGGVAFADIDFAANMVFPGVGTGSVNQSKWKTGWVAGAGVEHAFAENWSIKLEYQYLDFSSVTFNGVQLDANQIPIGAIAAKFDPSIHTVRIGVNGRFATGR